jgi:hypothetical protein
MHESPGQEITHVQFLAEMAPANPGFPFWRLSHLQRYLELHWMRELKGIYVGTSSWKSKAGSASFIHRKYMRYFQNSLHDFHNALVKFEPGRSS